MLSCDWSPRVISSSVSTRSRALSQAGCVVSAGLSCDVNDCQEASSRPSWVDHPEYFISITHPLQSRFCRRKMNLYKGLSCWPAASLENNISIHKRFRKLTQNVIHDLRCEAMFPFVCLSACLRDYTKTTEPIFVKHGGRMGHGPRKNPFNSGPGPCLFPQSNVWTLGCQALAEVHDPLCAVPK